MSRTTSINGKQMKLEGTEIKIGDKAPDFKMVDTDGREVTLAQSKGKIRLLSVIHSLDTPVCSSQTHRLELEANKYPDVVIYTISMDLPFTQARFIKDNNIRGVKTLSDHLSVSFGKAYGVLIEDLRLLSRAVFIIDENDIVRYVEYVPEVSMPADFDKALEALRRIAGAQSPAPMTAAGSRG